MLTPTLIFFITIVIILLLQTLLLIVIVHRIEVITFAVSDIQIIKK